MATTGAAKARSPKCDPVRIKEGRVSVKKIVAFAGQRIPFENQDNREYRLRLRNGYTGKAVEVCVFLAANGLAELVVDPGVEKLRAQAKVTVSVLPVDQICAASGVRGGGPVNPPKSVAIIVTDECTPAQTN